MNALTIMQPYAALIALPDDDDRAKRVENRTWAAPAHAIGSRLAIHAGKSLDMLKEDSNRPGFDIHGFEIKALHFGLVIATATLAGCFKATSTYWAGDSRNVPEWAARRWPWLLGHEHSTGPYCWVLTEVIAIKHPVPWGGFQGLWTFPADKFSDDERLSY